MHTFLSTRLTRAAIYAARPARRRVVRALRHHSARTRALAEQWRETRPVDNIRTWFRTFFSALRVQGATRRFSLRTLLRKPLPLRLAAARHEPVLTHSMSRKPRRTSITSTGWFAFLSR